MIVNRFVKTNEDGSKDVFFGTREMLQKTKPDWEEYYEYNHTPGFHNGLKKLIFTLIKRDKVMFLRDGVKLSFNWENNTFQFIYSSVFQMANVHPEFESEFLRDVGYSGGFERLDAEVE